MYGVVSTDHSRRRKPTRNSPCHPPTFHHHHQQYQIQSQQSVESTGQQSQQQQQQRTTSATTPQHQKSMYGRLVDFVKQAWTFGVKFALDSEMMEECELVPRYRPESIQSLCRITRFTEPEMKRIYRGFKSECPSGIVKEDTFREIYAQFFPQGANSSHYAHYVFNTLDQGHSGLISFQDFVLGLSILLRGSAEEKLGWIFRLYDINRDGFISREEMSSVVTAIFELMGSCAEPVVEESAIQERVDQIFQEFLESCSKDENISKSIYVFDSIV